MLDVAYRAFAEQGYETVSMDAIAAGAGVTKPLVYSYFGSKEELFAACLERLVEANLAALREAVRPGLRPDQQLWAGILAQLTFIDERRDEWNAYVREAVVRGGPAATALGSGRHRLVELLADLVERGLRDQIGGVPPRKEVELAATALQGAMEQVAAWWEHHPSEPKDAVALRLMNFAWQGMDNIMRGQVWLPDD